MGFFATSVHQKHAFFPYKHLIYNSLFATKLILWASIIKIHSVWIQFSDFSLGTCNIRASSNMPTGTNIEGSPCYAVHDKSSCFPFKWFEEGDKVEFLLTASLRQIVVSAILKTWGTHALVALCNPFSSWYKHSKRTHTICTWDYFQGMTIIQWYIIMSSWHGKHISWVAESKY